MPYYICLDLLGICNGYNIPKLQPITVNKFAILAIAVYISIFWNLAIYIVWLGFL